MPNLPLRVLDVVRLGDHPELARDGSSGCLGVVRLVRLMDDGAFRYEVMGLDADDDDVIGGIYDAVHLIPAGGRATLDQVNRMPPGLRARDIAIVAADYRTDGLAGRHVELDGAVSETGSGEPLVSVWCPVLQGSFDVPPRFLVATGQRLPARPLGRRVESTRVSVDGEVIGSMSYTVVDDLSYYS